MKKHNVEKRNEVLDTMNDMLTRLNSYDRVAVTIYGKTKHMTEREVRCLQVLAMRKANESDEAFKEFCDNVIVHSGPTLNSYVMRFTKNGRFENKFPCGFYDVCGNFNIEIIRNERHKKQDSEV